MPHHLEIESDGVRVAEMMTSHLRGTHYNIYWCSNTGFHHNFPNFDTGVECQPKDPVKRQLDFLNDFTHARRAIAAASKTAKMFLSELSKVKKIVASDFDIVHILLRTNCFDRGKITICPRAGEIANLRMEIGSGPIRPSNAQPTQVIEFNEVDVTTAGATSSLTLALKVLECEGPWMLKVLAENTYPPLHPTAWGRPRMDDRK
ncbi:MAG: hypothetical protein WBB69_04250 [Anaerolineales bacterium]